MSRGLRHLKTEMKGDTSRWGHRAVIKSDASKARRLEDKKCFDEALESVLSKPGTIALIKALAKR